MQLKYILPLVLTSLYMTSCTSQPSQTESPSKPSNLGILIDDFNERNDKSEIPLSVWTTYNDIQNGGGSKIRPRSDLYPNAPDYQTLDSLKPDSTRSSMRFDFELHKEGFKWDPFVGYSLNFMAQNVTQDLQAMEGIQFWTRGSGFTFIAKLNGVLDYAHYQVKVPAHKEWTLVQIPFKLLQQPSWGQSITWDPQQLTNFDWMIMGADQTQGTLELDQISWLLEGQYQAPEPKVSDDYFKESWVPPKDSYAYIESPQVSVKPTPWYQNYQAAYALTFDDGLASQHRELKPILDEYQLKATFYILTEHLGDSLNPPAWRFGTWSQFLDLAREGHELAGHDGDALSKYAQGSFQTPNTLQYQLAISRINLEEKLGKKVINYAYPMTDYNSEIQAEGLKYYQSLRAGNPATAMSAQAQEVPWSALHSRVISFPQPRGEANDQKVLEQMKQWIDSEVIATGKWHVFTAHDVLPLDSILAGDPGYHSISKQWMNQFAKYLSLKQSKKQLWVTPLENIVKYLKQKEKLTWGVVVESEEEVQINFKDSLDNSTYNHPVTLEITVNKNWKFIEASYDDKVQDINVIDSKIQLDIVPDKGLLILTNKSESI